MGWNVEVACIRVANPGTAKQMVPDVFSPTGEMVGFEDATSVMRGTDLCVGVVGEWAVLIDVECRLSAAGPWLVEASAGGDLFLVRVADQPVAIHYRNGAVVAEYRGMTACAKALKLPRTSVRGRLDGEQVACDLLKTWTGIGFPDDVWKTQFAVHAIG